MGFIENFKKINPHRGQILVIILIGTAIFAVFSVAVLNWVSVNYRGVKNLERKELAFHIAEAGIEYYRWHLAHDPDDYQDGTGGSGPYVHNFLDTQGEVIGQFSLEIIPPPRGSSLVTLVSTGFTLAEPQNKRKIRVQLAIPSVARFAVAANDNMRFGSGTEVFGAIHSNKGIRFDGLAHNLISSSLANYDDPDHTGPNEFGVHTHVLPVDPYPPATPPPRPDVFMAGREFPVPQVDFSGFTINLANLKEIASTSGSYFPPSGDLGYYLRLNADGTFDIHRVVSLVARPSGCSNDTWSIASSTPLFPQSNFFFPDSGVIFVEDNLWIDGQINNTKLTIASAVFPEQESTNSNIIINNNLSFTSYDGSAALGLIAQKNIQVGLKSQNNLRIDGALIAKNGWIRRIYYNSYCGSEYIRNSITLNGMIATNQRYGFAYTDGTGYRTRIINYDANLLYLPPPFFPMVSDQYSIISWEEIE